MKFSLVATLLVVSVVAQGSEARSSVKREVQAEVDRLTQILKDMSASVSTATQDLVEKMKSSEMTNTAQANVQPSVEKVQAEAAKSQEQVKPFISNIEEHIRPSTDDISAQMRPSNDMMEKFLQQVVEQSKASSPPQ